jgi:hypothetical protein
MGWFNLVRRPLLGPLYQPRMTDECGTEGRIRTGKGNWNLFIHQWLYRPLLGPGPFFNFVILFTQSVGHLGWVISPSQGRYLHTGQHKHRINAQGDIHALSGIRTHDPSVRASLRPAATVIGEETELLGENPTQIPHGLAWEWTRAAALKSRKLDTWAMAMPSMNGYKERVQSRLNCHGYFRAFFR